MAEAAQEPVELTKQKACVLKASIHCEGCKRKVKKILTQVQGVEFVDVDTKLQKVTVFGSVEPETLLKKLLKSGKHAELWPEEISHKKEKKVSKINEEKPKSEKQKKVAHNQEAEIPTSKKAVKEPETSGKEQEADKSSASALKSAAAKISEVKTDGGDASAKTNGGDEESKLEKKKTDEGLPDASEAVEIKSNGGGESVASGKKKKKKGQNRNLPHSAAPSAATPAPAVVAENYEPGPPLMANDSVPRGLYNPPTPHHYYTPPTPPVYGLSYNTAYPTSSYTTSYYAAPPPYSYAYAYPQAQPPPLDQEYPRQPLDSFEIFSDENPNGCSVA